MKTIISALFICSIIPVSLFAQDRCAEIRAGDTSFDELQSFSILSPVQSSITTAEGWSLQDNGSWASAINTIPFTDTRTNTSRPQEVAELGLSNFIALEMHKLVLDDQQYNVLIHRYKDGEYEFPFLRKNWQSYSSLNYYVFRSEKFDELLPQEVQFNVPYLVDLECFAIGTIKNYDRMIFKDDRLNLRAHATGVISSFAQNRGVIDDQIIKQIIEVRSRKRINDGNFIMAVFPIRSDGQEVVRFKLIRGYDHRNLIRMQVSPDNWTDLFSYQFYETSFSAYERFIRDSQQYFIDLDGQQADAYASHYNWGMLRYQIGDYISAEEAFSKALIENPRTDDFMIFAYRGIARTKMGLYCDAIDDFNRAIALKPSRVEDYANWTKNYFNRGVAKYYIDEREGACADWLQAYDLGYGSADEYLLKYCGRRVNSTVQR